MTQLPPRIHTSVNSGRSNPLIEATSMSEALEPWSHPWHALQRALAQAFGEDPAAHAAFAARRPAFARTADATWLARARLSAAPSIAAP
jgi:hypothetical protein